MADTTIYSIDTTGWKQDKLDLHNSLMRNELRGGRGAYELSHAETENSGYSYGPAQFDLTSNPESRDLLENALDLYSAAHPEKLSPKTRDAIMKAVKTNGKSTLVERHKPAIAEALSLPEIKTEMAALYNGHLEKIRGFVKNVVTEGQSKPNAKAFVNSREGKVLIGDWINRTGEATKFIDYVKGEEVSLDDKRNRIKLTKPLTPETFRSDYLGNTTSGRLAARDLDRRHKNSLDVIRTNPETKAPETAKPKPNSDQRSDAASDPKIKSFMADITAPDEGVSEVMYKQPAQWTEGEMKSVMASEPYMKTGHPERARAVEGVRAWHDVHYGTQLARQDETGRMIAPTTKVTPPQSPTPAIGADKIKIANSLLNIGGDVAKMAGKTGLGKAIKALQLGLNVAQNGPGILLKTDGRFGPKTKAATQAHGGRTGPGRNIASLCPGPHGIGGGRGETVRRGQGIGENRPSHGGQIV